MALREILQLGNPLLREPCEYVLDPTAPEIKRIAADLADTVAHSYRTTGYGRAIAAPQIGEMVRMVHLSVPEPMVLVNPEIVERSPETMIVWDACLSFLCIFMQVERHKTIVVRYQDLEGKSHELQAGAENDLSELLQHEIDHLSGILAIDRVIDPKTICTREEFERRYQHESPYAAAEVTL